MSNNVSIDWAYNNLTISVISSEKADLLDLWELSQDLQDVDDLSPLTFYTHSPIPDLLIETVGHTDEDTIKECVAKTGHPTLHQYTLKVWGCVTDASEVNFTQSGDDELKYEFKTRSTPPMGWLRELSEQYPELMFEMESTNEFELFEEFDVVYIDGKQVLLEYHKRQRD